MDNNNMKTFKILKDKRIQLDGKTWRPYCISDLPNHFGCIGFERDDEGNITRYGVSEWFGYQGFTYIPEN
jgi:hypothetical protein